MKNREKKDRRRTKRRQEEMKALVLLMAVILVIGSVVGSTVAWLIAKTEKVTNTFTYGDIDIKLEETDTNLDGDNDPNTNDYKMMPGKAISKDPKVTVLPDNEDCWLFVELEKSENFDDFLEYVVADGWTQLQDENGNAVEGVFYRTVDADTDGEGVAYDVLKDNQVTVKGTVTKEMLNALNPEGEEASYPTLTITAYAVQRDSEIEAIDTAAEAWALVKAEQAQTPESSSSASSQTPESGSSEAEQDSSEAEQESSGAESESSSAAEPESDPASEG